MQNFYQPGDRFNLNGSTYTIRTVTDNAIELSQGEPHSLWSPREAFEKLLGIQGKTGLFRWQNYLLDKAR